MHAKWPQSCLTLYNPVECIAWQAHLSMGILQARILQWIAISSSRGSFQLRDGTKVAYISCTGGQVKTTSVTWEAPVYYRLLEYFDFRGKRWN